MRYSSRLLAVLLFLSIASIASTAAAQSASKIGARVFGAVDINTMAASDSFKAVFDTSTVTAFGAGVDITNLWKNVFARVAFTHASKDGERAFVFNNQVIPLGVPLSMSMNPVEVGAGWRFASKSATAKITPYVGAGALLMRYKEESPYASTGDDVDISKTGGVVFGGVDVVLTKFIFVGGEAQYRTVPDAIGDGGVSKDYDENDLGGFTMRIRFGVRF